MQSIEFETWIDKNGYVLLTEKFQHAYGKPPCSTLRPLAQQH